ncbi:hypothetical protein ASG43_04855 [Aureimonas sp. Leaf454]|uniref:hypothetical protein n=1 Tax=Aureimonas sp. Leaf454 TaxID=1736381 RepID=UPI0007125BA6|nr:hypothetical protein [Aureimonas sp. Leaf454]KQT54874.1 hypothetical protein ASG43_04855 [Aureimonas sp. Leaf454]
MSFVVSVETTVAGGITLPPDRYAGTVEWKETLTRSGFERSKKRYRVELSREDLLRWGGQADPDGSSCLIDITAEVASGEIGVL